MIIVHKRKRKQFLEVFEKTSDFELFLRENYSCLNFDSEIVREKIKYVFELFIDLDEVVQYTRLTRRLKSAFGFLHKNVTKKEYWIERGWSEEYALLKIKNDTIERAKQQSKTRQKQLINKNDFVEDGLEKEFRFISGSFHSKKIPQCNICNSVLKLQKVNINNIQEKFYYKIINCSNSECATKSFSKNEKYIAFLPKENADEIINKISKNIKQKNILSIEGWINKGYSEEDAKKEIFKLQSKNSKKRKNPFIPTKDNLKKHGYTDLEIEQICLSPTQEEFWINKGLPEKEAKEKVSELQKINSLKFVEKRRKNPDSYSAMTQTQIGYWINKGYSKGGAEEKIKERQKTFSLDKCVEKYGEEEGQKRWRERQEKWLKSYKRNNYSQVSQELFWEVYNQLPMCYKIKNEIYFATLNQKTKGKESENRNNEYRLRLSKQVILPDFFVLNEGKIIEFDGVYYHRNTPENQKRELNRDEQIKDSGYLVFHVNELEYKTNKQEIINKCLEFLEIKK